MPGKTPVVGSPGWPILPAGLLIAVLALAGCKTPIRFGALEPRQGDEIVVAGQFFHTGTRVVLWLDPDGYDAYRVERRFGPPDHAGWDTSRAEAKDLTSPNRYNSRRAGLSDEEIERVRGGGWDLAMLQNIVDQFVVHYDASGTSRQCFRVLHDVRGLSVHFLLDLDGTIYQTLDLKERAWHATTSNSRSIGIEIANIGAYGPDASNPFDQWYVRGSNGLTRLVIPDPYGDGGELSKDFTGRPARPEPVMGIIQGKELVQYDFTPEQYQALTRLTASLCNIFPKLTCDYPRDDAGELVREKLPEDELKDYHGVLGHFHIQTDKIDPGPAFQWDTVIDGARKLLATGAVPRYCSPKFMEQWPEPEAPVK